MAPAVLVQRNCRLSERRSLTRVRLIETIGGCAARSALGPFTFTIGTGLTHRRILGRKITDCRPIKLVAAMSEQRQEPVVQKTS